MAAAMGYLAPICYKLIVEKAGNQKKWYIFFWVASFVATVCNGAILVFEIMHLSTVGPVYQFHITKIILEPLFCLLDIVLAICITESDSGFSTQQQEAQESPNLTQQTEESPSLMQQAHEPPEAQEPPNLTQQAAESPNLTQQAAEPPNSTQQAAEPPDSTQEAPESSSPNST